MSLQELLDKAKAIKEKARLTKEALREVNEALDVNLSEPYTFESLPEYIKKKPKHKQEIWLKTFNASFDKGEEYAFKAANAAIKEDAGLHNEVNIKNVASVREILTELIADIEAFLSKAEIGIKGKIGSPAVRQFLREVKEKVKNMIAEIKEADLKEAAEKIVAKLDEVTKEDNSEDVKEAKFEILNPGKEEDLAVTDFISLKEAKFNSDFSEVEVTLIEAGTNEAKRRHYPVKTIKEAAGIFKGWKMYINHPTAAEEKERPERNLRDWASTIVESRYDNGKAIGVVAIHDTWLRERLADPVAREHIGLSINTGGKISTGRVNGQEMQIVEAIVPRRKNGPPSVDWVTEPGARGKVNRLMESRFKGVGKMELEIATIKDLKESRTDLVEAIRKESEAGNVEKVAKLEKDLQEAHGKIVEFEKVQKIAVQARAVEVALKEAKIPEASKARIKESFSASLIEGDLKEAVTKAIDKELDYVNKLSNNGKIKIGNAAEGDIKESLSKDLDARAGIKEEKKEED